ncbi:hypothetical protein C8D70_105302, partial [Chryseobacterium sp. CBTAP 102]|uniref:hypothetical protein n=1 Tax=Chryseobacterium sp. CBTAP 102 TaxID=2135644 RepID=UPI000D7617A2
PDTKLTISTPDNSFGLNHTNGTVNLKTYIGGGTGYIGTTTPNNLNLTTDNIARVTVTSGGKVGMNMSSPGTTLDVNGAITNRETALAVNGNAVTVPANVSQVQITGAATANVAIFAPAAPNPGQRLIVYNNTTGGFGATLDGVTVPNGKVLEFVFSNSFWRSTDGGSVGAASTNIYSANGTLAGNRTVTTAGNSLSFTNGSNSFSIGTAGTEGIVRSVGSSRGSVLATGGGNTLSMYADDNGKAVMMTSGSNTGMDIGAATADPVNILTNNTQRIVITGSGNIGINTATPDVSALLQLNASNKGFMLPRVFLTSITDATTVATPANGLLVYNYNAATAPYGTGIYYNTGTSAAPKWSKLAPQTTDYQLLGVFTDVATSPVNQTATGSGVIVDDLNLGLSVSVTVPANSTAKIVVDYSVPMGTTSSAGAELGYYGVRFLRNGVEAPAGSRKYTIPEGGNGSQMVSTSGKYSETYNNTSASPVVITYTLNGYAESTNHPVRFNMWAASGANFNWGVGSITATAFAKDN